MQSFGSNGKLSSEINHFRTSDGKSITTNTPYNNGRPTAQNVTVCDTNTGKVTSTNTIGGKLLP